MPPATRARKSYSSLPVSTRLRRSFSASCTACRTRPTTARTFRAPLIPEPQRRPTLKCGRGEAISSKKARLKRSAGQVLKVERFARRLGPAYCLQPMGGEHRERKPIHTEGDAAGVHDRAGFVAQVPGHAEVIAVIVEAHAGGRLCGRAHRNEQLEFQRPLNLAHCHELTAAVEESVARLIHAVGQFQLL